MGDPAVMTEPQKQSTTSQKKLKTDLTDYTAINDDKTGPYAENLELDALIVGAGFSGVFMLKTLRERGLKTVVFEAGNDLGGTWRWNCYPGARVDSEVPVYNFSWPEVYKTWNWSTNYPDYTELRAYFDHVDKVVGIKKDCSFGTVVIGANFDTEKGVWNVKTSDGRLTKCKFLIVGAGFAAKRYIPDWPGIDKFRGVVHHSSFWPDEDIPVAGKRCGVIGTGASGVQISQTWGPLAGDLKLFQRTPNLAVPMGKRPLTVEEQEGAKHMYPQLFEMRELTAAGFLYDWVEKKTFEDSPEERERFYQSLFDHGGFGFWLANYKDMLRDKEANKEAYKFWAKTVRARVGDPQKRELLAPLEMPHYFGVKRPCLEQNYYEQFNRENVHVIDVKANPVKEFTETGIVLEDGTHHELDVIAIATGFDITTGGMTSMGLESINSTDLQSEWKASANTYLGVTISGYPNMFHMYGPHGPTLLSNGVSTVEVQGRWITDAIVKTQREGIKYFNPTESATKEWKKNINDLSDATLFPTTKSTYMGGSLPGKAFEQVNYVGGIPAYKAEIRDALREWKGFDVVKDQQQESTL